MYGGAIPWVSLKKKEEIRNQQILACMSVRAMRR